MSTRGSPVSSASSPSWLWVGGFSRSQGRIDSWPLVSRMAYSIPAGPAYPWARSSSSSSSTVSRLRRISPWSIFPLRMMTLGRPHRRVRNRVLFMVSTDRIMVRDSRVRMGTIPVSRGMPKSCMGTAARSAMIRVRASSLGSSSPICRFPMSRRPTVRTA